MRILLAEPLQDIREKIHQLLAGETIINIAGGEPHRKQAALLDQIELISPDLIVWGNHLPYDFPAWINQIKTRLPHVRFIVLTFYSLGKYRMDCLDAGIDEVLNKVADLERLPQIVDEYQQAKNNLFR